MRRFFLLSAILLLLTATVQAGQRKPVCVLDDSKRTLCLDKPARKIISLSPGSTELLFAAGAGQFVIAVDKNSNYPLSVKKLPSVGGHKSVNVEAILGMQPDLIVVWSSGSSDRVIRKIEALGLNTLHLDAKEFDQIGSAIQKLAILAGTEKAAQKSIKQFNKRLSALNEKYSSKETVTVFYEVWRDPLLTINGDQLISKTIKLCGGHNIFSEAVVLVPTVSKEVLFARNPEVILGSEHQKSNRDSLREYWQQFSSLTAVKRQQIYTVPADLISRPTPRLLEAAEQVCQIFQSVRNAREEAVTNNKTHSDEKA
ncbi:cobalamin-binding protein [Endozoicomonas sp. OPT23]|uniref:cobalamin-binding protein n=1 Tax=Endozoicomonas sp. OPT23 TaxID=2072845 RepID=UPI00129A8DDD